MACRTHWMLHLEKKGQLHHTKEGYHTRSGIPQCHGVILLGLRRAVGSLHVSDTDGIPKLNLYKGDKTGYVLHPFATSYRPLYSG